MAGAQARPYRAFISYAHKNTAAGDRLYRRLKGDRPLKALFGWNSPRDRVREKFYPTLRERDDVVPLSARAGHFGQGLQASNDWMKSCSQQAATCRWANEEIWMVGGVAARDRTHAVVFDGEPGRVLPRARRKGAIVIVVALLTTFAGSGACRADVNSPVVNARLSRAKAAFIANVRSVATLIDRVVEGSRRGGISVAVADHVSQTAQRLIASAVHWSPPRPSLRAEQAMPNRVLSQHASPSKKQQERVRWAENVHADSDASGDARAQHRRAVALDNEGDGLLAAGDRAGALKAYEESLDIRRWLAEGDPGNAGWARDLIVSNVKLAEISSSDAMMQKHYAAALAIAEDLARGGRLAPADAWMIDDLRARLAAVPAARNPARSSGREPGT